MKNHARRISFWLLAAAILISFGCAFEPEIPESARLSYESLRKIDVKISVGVNLLEYSKGVSDAAYYVTEFMRSDQAKRLPQLANHLSKSLECHLTSLNIWRSKLDSSEIYGESPEGKLIINLIAEYDKSLIKTKDQDWNSYQKSLAKYFTFPYGVYGHYVLIPDNAMQTLWHLANQETEAASKIVRKSS